MEIASAFGMLCRICYYFVMQISISSELAARGVALTLGVLSLAGLTVRERDDALWSELERVSAEFAAR